MGRILIFDYTFDASAQTVTLDGIWQEKQILMVNNATRSKIIYSPFDPTRGLSASFTFDYEKNETTMPLTWDTTSYADTDTIQIFADNLITRFEPSEAYTDPVSKLRVSNPENLIDTDFEYGLQSTKWETLELTANIPTFFSRAGDAAINLSDITVVANSDIVTVTTTSDHGLVRGTPILVKGSQSILADGGFIITSILSPTSFTYQGKGTFTQSLSLKDTYSEIFVASIYEGTEFKLTNVGGMTSDEATPSTLTVNTEYPTKFTNGTKVALTNTFAKSELSFDTADTDIDNVINFSQSYTSNTATGEDNQYSYHLGGVQPFRYRVRTGRGNADTGYSGIWFVEGSTTVDTGNDYITFTEPHNLQTYDVVMYVGDKRTNSPIGGLWYGGTYVVQRINNFTIRLSWEFTSSSSTSYRMQLSGNGVSGGVVKSAFLRGIGIWEYRNSYSRFRFQYSSNWYNYPYNSLQNLYEELAYNGGTSGYNSGFFGRMPNGTSSSSTNLQAHPLISTTYYTDITTGTANYEMFNLPSTGNSVQPYTSSNYYLYSGYGYVRYYTSSTLTYSQNTGFFRHSYDVDGGRWSLYLPNHGLNTYDYITLRATAGSLPSGLSSGTLGIPNYRVEKIDDNRIMLRTTTGGFVYLSDAGTTDLEYTATAVLPKLVTSNTVKVPGNTLLEGDKVTYSDGGGSAITGLVDGTDYYVADKVTDTGQFRLSTTKSQYTGDQIFIFESSSLYIIYNTNTLNAYSQSLAGFSNGDAVKYETSYTYPLPGLGDGGIYWIGSISGTNFKLYNSYADAIAATNEVQIPYYNISNQRTTLSKVNLVDLTALPSPAETHTFSADFIGAADGNYEIASTAADQQSFTLTAPNKIEYRTTTGICNESFNPDLNGFRIVAHGLITGDAVQYSTTGTVNVSGITGGTTYYAITIEQDLFRLAASEADALAGTAITLTEAAGTGPFNGSLNFESQSMIGETSAAGTVSYSADHTLLFGTGTDFASYYTRGDSVRISIPGSEKHDITGSSTSDWFVIADTSTLTTGEAVYFTATTALPTGIALGRLYFINVLTGTTFAVYDTRADAIADTNRIQIVDSGNGADAHVYISTGEIVERTIKFVNSSTEMTMETNFPSTAQSGLNILQKTRVLLRPDGFALHRPYDGGVELIPPTNPDATMIRQTRKYFRYQSGKGIQVSFAVNFSPTSQIDTFSRSGTTGTITTRYPHRLSVGSDINISGATNAADTIGTEVVEVAAAYDAASGGDKFNFDGGLPTSYTLYEGRTYRFDVSDTSNATHVLAFSEDANALTTSTGIVEYTTGVTRVGSPGNAGAYVEFIVPSSAPELYVYCTVHDAMGFPAPTSVDPNNNQKILWNGDFSVQTVPDPYSFTVTLDGTPSNSEASGIVEYYVRSWTGSNLRCGLFDDQNGLFFEYTGSTLNCCRRSATRQISGTVQMTFRSGQVLGTNTHFLTQVSVDDNIVIKGQTYRITRIDSDTEMHIAPSYRGVDISGAIITIIETTREPQDQWNLDTCDGTGYTGFKLDIHKIQMAYLDYSWYGAGKVRFGFKDQNGDVKYVHQFVHGNVKTEAFMRSGNMPARYEIQNIGQPTYVPALAHWGTSVIMDGKFDPDKAYIFNASSNNITLTGADSQTTNARVSQTGYYYAYTRKGIQPIGYALDLQNYDSELNSAAAGTVISSGVNIPANTELANPLVPAGQLQTYQPYQPYWGGIYTFTGPNYNNGAYRRLLWINNQPTGTSGSYSSYTIGQAGSAISPTKDVPLISIRLAPSVDTSAPGFLGEREIINRMQLILNQVSVVSTHAVTVRLVVNGALSTNDWQRVTNPSLSQLIIHANTDTIEGGQPVYNFEAAGGSGTSNRTPVLTTESLGELATLGNSILGGDGVYPDGPDVLTVVATLSEDASTVSTTNPLITSGRISWSESQA